MNLPVEHKYWPWYTTTLQLRKKYLSYHFFISNAICHQGHHKGDYFKHEALKQLKPVAISFALVIKIILYFPRVLNANRFWKCNIF